MSKGTCVDKLAQNLAGSRIFSRTPYYHVSNFRPNPTQIPCVSVFWYDVYWTCVLDLDHIKNRSAHVGLPRQPFRPWCGQNPPAVTRTHACVHASAAATPRGARGLPAGRCSLGAARKREKMGASLWPVGSSVASGVGLASARRTVDRVLGIPPKTVGQTLCPGLKLARRGWGKAGACGVGSAAGWKSL